MAHPTLTITDHTGTRWVSELCSEIYALLVAGAYQMDIPIQPQSANPDIGTTNIELSDYAIAVLKHALLQKMSDSESENTARLLESALHLLLRIRESVTLGVRMHAAIGHTLEQARAAGIECSSEDISSEPTYSRWHVSGIVSYGLTGTPHNGTGVIDMNVMAADWHAAETAAITRMRSALDLDPDMQFDYTWAAGPDVSQIS